MVGIADIVSGIFKPITDIVDHLTMSGDDKAKLQEMALQAQINAASAVTNYEQQLLTSQAQIITAEAQGGSWIQRNWRPITMLTFVALVVARWCGWAAPNLPEAEALELWGLIKIGLGGYVIGRSVEKTAAPIAQVIKGK